MAERTANLSRTQAYKARFSVNQGVITAEPTTEQRAAEPKLFPGSIGYAPKHDCPPELVGLLTCPECGEVSTEWYDCGDRIEAFCDCNQRPGRVYGCWVRRKSDSAVYVDAVLERWARDGVPSS